MTQKVTLEGKIWKYDGSAAWYFLTSTKEQAELIKSRQQKRIGWGSVPVRVTLGNSTWDTSVFPSKEGVYLLPLKAGVRKKEGLTDGTQVRAECVFI